MLGALEWTDERIDALVKLSADGLTAGQIAERLGGVSRNAVIGKLHRLQHGQSTREARRVRLRPAPPAPPAPARTALVYGEARDRAGHEPVGFLALQQHMCRWPIGDPASERFGFCGQTIRAGSYCERHADVSRLKRA
jgi:GcrA cell cycle regulator